MFLEEGRHRAKKLCFELFGFRTGALKMPFLKIVCSIMTAFDGPDHFGPFKI